MPEMSEFPPGMFCWLEIATLDRTAAKSFYSGLFGWEAEDQPAGPDMVYTMLRRTGKGIGGLYELTEDQKKMGIPPHWLAYVSVESADETTGKAESLGGKAMMGPMDVMDFGRMSVLQDPTGAPFAIWQPKSHHGAEMVSEPGTMCWNEVLTKDTKKAGEFYTRLFGWQAVERPMGPTIYTMFMQGKIPIGGMMTIPPEAQNAPPHWLTYIAVNDCDATVAKVKASGGKMCAEPMDIPDVGRMAVSADPHGAVFAYVKLIDPA